MQLINKFFLLLLIIKTYQVLANLFCVLHLSLHWLESIKQLLSILVLL